MKSFLFSSYLSSIGWTSLERIIIERKGQDVFSCWNNEHEPDVSDEDINLVNPPVPTEFVC